MMPDRDEQKDLFQLVATLNAAIAGLRLYSPSHPKVTALADQAHAGIARRTANREKTTAWLIEDELLWDGTALKVKAQQAAAVPRGLTGTAALEPELPGWTPNELGRLVDWVADTYAGPLLATLRKLIQKRRVYGKLAGDTFLPEHLFALSLERIEPFFAQLSTARRWISIEEICWACPISQILNTRQPWPWSARR